jgi:hypothetical protein
MGMNDRSDYASFGRPGQSPGKRDGRGGAFAPLRGSKPLDRVDSIVNVASDDLGKVVQLALRSGVAVMFASTSDRGAVSVTVFAGDDKSRSYCSDAEEFADSLLAVQALCDVRGGGNAPTPIRGA